MADLFDTMSSWLEKLNIKSRKELPPGIPGDSPAEPERSQPEIDLGALPQEQLREFISRQPERAVTKLLGALSDPELQLRVVQCVSDEATLKRVSRSELSKKLRRAAEKQLRETGAGGAELRTQQLDRLCDPLQAFFRKPDWEKAPELLHRVFDPALPDGTSHPLFDELRNRLKREIHEYEATCAELESLCDRLEALPPLGKNALSQLQSRWKDLEEKYAFSKSSDLLRRYSQALEAQRAPRKPAPQPPAVAAVADAVPSAPSKDSAQTQAQDESRAESRAAENRRRAARAEALEKLRVQLRELESRLADRQTGPRLGEIRTELAELRRWRREFAASFDEAEELLKTLSGKRTEAVDEARWDSWARTDLALRIQGELEKTIGELETENDAEAALKRATGLTERLHDYAKEMRALGSLDRSKDHKIWEQFKSLSARGWVICDKMRAILAEKLKTELSALASREIDFSVSALTGTRAAIGFKPLAFEEAAASRLKELQTLWSAIGAKPSELNREVEIVGSKLIEIYFRQLNLHQGKLKRSEAEAIHEKRTLLNEMKLTCEGKSSLLARTRVAKSLEERWKKSPVPESVAAALGPEFETYRLRLSAELDQEIAKAAELAAGLRTQAEATLASIVDKTATSLTAALKSVAALEAELRTLEQYLSQYSGLAELNADFKEIQGRLKTIFGECRKAAEKETSDRAGQRNQVLAEAQTLALSTDWAASQARLGELKQLWKKVGALGQAQDSLFDLLFENALRFYRSRAEQQGAAPALLEKNRKTRREILCSLDALTRFQQQRSKSKADVMPLPFAEAERAKAAGKTLELGMKYRQILSLDPQAGLLKETRKIMEQWSGLGSPDEPELAAHWDYYLKVTRTLLELPPIS